MAEGSPDRIVEDGRDRVLREERGASARSERPFGPGTNRGWRKPAV